VDPLSRVACRLITVVGLAAGAGACFADVAAIVAVGLASLGVVFLYGIRR
jgi:hypothetical protein